LGAVIQGYRHGSIRESFSLFGLFVGILLAPLLVGPVAGLVRTVSSSEINISRLIALMLVIAVPSIGFTIGGIRTARKVEIPGPRRFDRVGGSMLALMRAVTLLSLALYGLIAFSGPGAMPGFSEMVDGSVSGRVLADPESPFTAFYDGVLSRSDDLRALTLWVRQRAPLDEHVPSDRLDFTGSKDVELDRPDERKMLELLNAERQERGLAPLQWCEVCARVARGHSKDMYVNGYFSHVDPDGHDPFERMKLAGVTYRAAGENLAIAPTVSEAHDALMSSPDHRENILREVFDQVGIGIYEGPYGLMMTEVFRTAVSS
jgi:uncharacterized membrane protein required for colicin V production